MWKTLVDWLGANGTDRANDIIRTVPNGVDNSRVRRATDKPLSERIVRNLYVRPRSFCDQLPYLEYLTHSQCFLLDDGISVGAVLDISPANTEGRSEQGLLRIRDGIEAALQDSFEELDANAGPWIVQFYCYDQTDFDEYLEKLASYVWPRAQGSEFTEHFLQILGRHLRGAAQSGGLFVDSLTDFQWQAKRRRTHAVIYRRWPRNSRSDASPIDELNEVVNRFVSALANADIGCTRMSGCDFYGWLLRWFNPRPALTDGDARALMRQAEYPDDDALPFAHDFTESLLFAWPRTDLASQTWWFDGLPHRAVTTQRLRAIPSVGHLTGERKLGDKIFSALDRAPENTVMALTIIVLPQDVLENHLNQLDKKAVGETAESAQTRRDVETAKGLLASGHKLYKAALQFYVRGNDLAQLKQRSNALSSLLLAHQIQPIRDADEQCAIDAYLLALPMVYDPKLDGHTQFARYIYAQHAASLSPLFGRGEGTGHPGFTFFNRGGAPLCFDPLNIKDRKKNAHMLILGPTGAGKSATLVYLIQQVLAVVRPRIFIVETGNSFGLLVDDCKSKGLTVNKVSMRPGSGVSIPPFADAFRLLEQPISTSQELADLPESPLDANDQEGDEQRDLLGEMEISAMLMITGGDVREEAKFDRADRRLIRDAILSAARHAQSEQRQTLTEDVAAALELRSQEADLPEQRRNRAFDMAACLRLWCDGFEGELFNSPGSLWPEVDVTHIDLATFAREGYSGQLAVAYTSIMNRINNLAEKYQHDERPTVMITDEGHIITTNPLLAPYVVKVVKMWRKLGAWYWNATQNLEDFPDAAKKMLNMIEWWLLLVMPPEEVKAIGRFRDLTSEQEQMLLATRKEPGKYTEGVVLSSSMQALFRVVPPSYSLALAMTEKHEKVERRKLMDEWGISEVQAAEKVGEALDRQRGILR